MTDTQRDRGSFAGRTILVTGAAGGIGSATVRILAERGARVILTDLPETDLAGAAAPAGAEAIVLPCDLADREATCAMFAEALRRTGGIDGLANIAGVTSNGATLAEQDFDEEWQRVFAINLTAPALLTQLFVRERKAKGRPGAIVNITSCAYLGTAQGGPYAASKAGLVNVTRNSALEFGPDNIRVNAIAPGIIDTPMNDSTGNEPMRQALDTLFKATPLRRIGEPREIGDTVAFLLSDEASFISGQTINVNGGSRLS